MSRIAIDARFYGTEHTGLGRYTQNVLTFLPKHLKSDRLYLLLRDRYYHTLKFPANVTKVHFDVPHYSLREQLLLPSLLSSLSVELLYTFHFNAPLFSSVPTVVTIHDLIKTYSKGSDTTTHAPWLYGLKRWGYARVMAHAATASRDLIVPTNTVKNELLAAYPSIKPEHIHPIPEAPDVAFRSSGGAKEALPKESLPTKYLLFVGNAYPHKNLSLVLKALPELPGLSLVIVSKASPFLERLLQPLSPTFRARVKVLSALSDDELVSVYRRASAVVCPSFMEGYGLIGLEALMVGTPVLASDIPVFREVYGDRVGYFDPHSVAEYVSAVRRVLKSPKKRQLLDFSRTWDDVAKEIAEVIHASRLSL